jgi:hypothetical protein
MRVDGEPGFPDPQPNSDLLMPRQNRVTCVAHG